MFELDRKSNLLEMPEFRYELKEIESPNMYREFYPYEDIPKVAFNNVHVPLNMPSEIWITDTTFRDGQQSREPYTTEQIVTIYKMLNKLGGPKGIIRQTEFFLYSEQDRRAVKECMELGYEFPEITSWIRASKSDFQLAKEMGIKETGILVSCSDYHIFHKLHMKRSQAIDHYLGIIKECIEAGIKPRCHFEDITRADIFHFVIPFARELMKLMKETGIPVKVRACDTMA